MDHFTFKVIYRRGKQHLDADALSRCHDANDDDMRLNEDKVDDAPHIADHILNVNLQNALYNPEITADRMVKSSKPIKTCLKLRIPFKTRIKSSAVSIDETE